MTSSTYQEFTVQSSGTAYLTCHQVSENQLWNINIFHVVDLDRNPFAVISIAKSRPHKTERPVSDERKVYGCT